MDNSEMKLKILDALYKRGVYMKKVNDVQYRTRCPFCGDSTKSENTGHLYLRVNTEDNFPILYHCFKCDASGVLNEKNIVDFDIDDHELVSTISTLNKNSSKYNKALSPDESEFIYFDYQLPKFKRSEKSKYIELRLGKELMDQDFEDMKFISSIKEFLEINHLDSNISKINIQMLEKYYVGFLSFGNSHILFRDITNTQKIRWLKYPISNESVKNKIFYSTKLSISKLSTEPININLTEGIMDILSVKHNLNHNTRNDINIAVSGKSYYQVILFMIDNGFFGSNVTINIYSDNDEMYNKKKNTIPTTIEWYRQKIGIFKNLFRTINVYYNLLDKDVGVPIDKISLVKFKL